MSKNRIYVGSYFCEDCGFRFNIPSNPINNPTKEWKRDVRNQVIDRIIKERGAKICKRCYENKNKEENE